MDIRDLDLSLKPTFTRTTVGAAGGMLHFGKSF